MRAETTVLLNDGTTDRREQLYNVRSQRDTANGQRRRRQRCEVTLEITQDGTVNRFEGEHVVVRRDGRCSGHRGRRHRSGGQVSATCRFIGQRRDNGGMMYRRSECPPVRQRNEGRVNGRSYQSTRRRHARRGRRRGHGSTRRLLRSATRFEARGFQRQHSVATRQRRSQGVIIRHAARSYARRGPRGYHQSRRGARGDTGGEAGSNGVGGLGRGCFPPQRQRVIGTVKVCRYQYQATYVDSGCVFRRPAVCRVPRCGRSGQSGGDSRALSVFWLGFGARRFRSTGMAFFCGAAGCFLCLYVRSLQG